MLLEEDTCDKMMEHFTLMRRIEQYSGKHKINTASIVPLSGIKQNCISITATVLQNLFSNVLIIFLNSMLMKLRGRMATAVPDITLSHYQISYCHLSRNWCLSNIVQ